MIFFCKRQLIFILFFVACHYASAQRTLRFVPTFENENFALKTLYSSEKQQGNFQLTTLKFYVSNLSFWQGEKFVFAQAKKHYLIDLENPISLSIPLEIQESIDFSSIKFNLGIDSITNVSGAMGGDLDPTNGMYWTWQSGYINFKMEGTSENCPARKNKFQFHLGGYLHPFNGLREIEMIVQPHDEIRIEFDLSAFFQSIDLSKSYQIMSPSEEAMQLADEIQLLFRLSK